MASNTTITRKKRQQKRTRSGRQRKNRLSRRSTRTAEEVFSEVDRDRQGSTRGS